MSITKNGFTRIEAMIAAIIVLILAWQVLAGKIDARQKEVIERDQVPKVQSDGDIPGTFDNGLDVVYFSDSDLRGIEDIQSLVARLHLWEAKYPDKVIVEREIYEQGLLVFYEKVLSLPAEAGG